MAAPLAAGENETSKLYSIVSLLLFYRRSKYTLVQRKKYTDMYTLLALHAMEGQLTEKCRTLTLERNMLVDSHQLC